MKNTSANTPIPALLLAVILIGGLLAGTSWLFGYPFFVSVKELSLTILQSMIVDEESIELIREEVEDYPEYIDLDHEGIGSPLAMAAQQQREELVDLLLIKGASVETARRDLSRLGDAVASAFLEERIAAIKVESEPHIGHESFFD